MPKKTPPSMVVALFEVNKKIHLLMTNEGKTSLIHGWKDMKAALAYFEGGYNRAHARSYEGSMSACINFMTFTPHLVEFADIDALKAALIDEATMALVQVSNISGYYKMLTCKPEAREVFDKAITPELITEEVDKLIAKQKS